VRTDHNMVLYGVCRVRPGFFRHTTKCGEFTNDSKPMTQAQYKAYKKRPPKSAPVSKSKSKPVEQSAAHGGTGSQLGVGALGGDVAPSNEDSDSEGSKESVSGISLHTLQCCHIAAPTLC
jgi:hypothetical protein